MRHTPPVSRFPLPAHTGSSGPATEPGAVSRPRAAPQIAMLVATGRRRTRLPAGFGSPRGRIEGAKACGNLVAPGHHPRVIVGNTLPGNALGYVAGTCASLSLCM